MKGILLGGSLENIYIYIYYGCIQGDDLDDVGMIWNILIGIRILQEVYNFIQWKVCVLDVQEFFFIH